MTEADDDLPVELPVDNASQFALGIAGERMSFFFS
jgi:hypothetical protein